MSDQRQTHILRTRAQVVALLGSAVIAVGAVTAMAIGAGVPDRGLGASGPHRCGRGDTAGDMTLGQAQRFRRFGLFYAGQRVVGFPLTAVLCGTLPAVDKPTTIRAPESYGVSPSWDFTYGLGNCDSGWWDESGCGYPIDVQENESCWDNLGDYSDRPNLQRLRGVPAAEDAGYHEVVLYTRLTTVTIDAPKMSQALRIARTLRGINNQYSAGSKLPAPSERTLEGHTKCSGPAAPEPATGY